MELLLWVALAAGAAAIEWWRRRRAHARRRAVKAWARGAGLAYERIDLTGQRLWRPFRLFGLGDERGIENVVHGTLNGTPVELFDYWYAVEHQQRGTRTLAHPTGANTKIYSRFTCALAAAPGGANWPHLSIAPESFASRLKAKAGFRDIEFESADFNRMFLVEATDRRFAFDVLDARLMSYLLLTEGRYEFELRDRDVLCVADQLPPEEWHRLGLVLAGFVERLPSTAVRRPRGGRGEVETPDRERPADDYGFFA